MFHQSPGSNPGWLSAALASAAAAPATPRCHATRRRTTYPRARAKRSFQLLYLIRRVSQSCFESNALNLRLDDPHQLLGKAALDSHNTTYDTLVWKRVPSPSSLVGSKLTSVDDKVLQAELKHLETGYLQDFPLGGPNPKPCMFQGCRWG